MHGHGNDSKNRLGKYRLLGELGRGGMASVYLAMVTGPARFNKLVVIKEIQTDLAYEPEFVTMFLDEARLAARLNHPNVVQTNEVGQDEYRFFMVMEYLEGQTLRSVLRRVGRGPDAPLTLGMKLRVMVEALAGLHYAHELADYDGTPLSVVHRDISPHNIFVTYSGQVKVLDFGIAKALDSVTETSTGVLKGKVNYMAPEQARGEPVDRRADVYAAGVVLWELATGDRMFKDLAQVVMLNKVMMGEVPSPREACPTIDGRLEAIIHKALSFHPADRHPTAAALADDLEQLLRELGDDTNTRRVGELVDAAFAAERARVRTLVESQIALVSEATSPAHVAPVPLFDPQASSSSLIGGSLPQLPLTDPSLAAHPPSLTPPTTGGISTALATGTTAVSGSQPRARWPWVALGALLLGGVGLAFAFRGGPESEELPVTGQATTHTLRIESSPAGAKVACRGEVVGLTPLEIDVPAGDAPCAFQLMLDGHDVYRVERGPLSGNETLVASLRPVPGADTADASASPSSGSAAPTVKPGPTRPSPRVEPPPPPPPEPPPPPRPKDDIRLKR